MKFENGDRVRSIKYKDRPIMTVVKNFGDMVQCAWEDNKGHHHCLKYYYKNLELV